MSSCWEDGCWGCPAVGVRAGRLSAGIYLRCQLHVHRNPTGTVSPPNSQVAALELGLCDGATANAAVEERAAGLEASLQELQGAAAAKEAELSATIAGLAADLEAACSAKEGAARELASVNMRLEIVCQEAAAKVWDGRWM